MKIQGNNPVEGKDLLGKVQDLRKAQEVEKQSSTQKVEEGKDKITLSGKAKEISELKLLIDQLPDVRMDKVEELKKAIDSGNYNIDARKIAEKILMEEM